MKINYEKIAQTYDKGRSYTESKLNFWLDKIINFGGLHPNSTVLDIGCGTGRYAIPLAEELSCSVVGIDLSKKMLSEAKNKSKSDRVQWICAEAEDLPFLNNIFDCCLMSFVVHHICNKLKAFREVHQVLSPNGICLIRTTSPEYLKNLPDYYFFPTALEIDMARLPDIQILKNTLSVAGFTRVSVYEVISPYLESAEEYLGKIRNRYTSTFYLLTEEEYNEGLRKAERYFSQNSLPEEWRTEPISIIVATRK